MNLNSVGKYFMMILFVMVGIFVIKWAAKKVNVPVLSQFTEAV